MVFVPTSALRVQMADRESVRRTAICRFAAELTVATPTSRKIEQVPRKPITRDVTHDYMDLDARLRNAQVEEARHLQILKRAQRSRTSSRARETHQLPGCESGNCKAKKYLGAQIDRSSLANLISSEQTARCGKSLAANASR